MSAEGSHRWEARSLRVLSWTALALAVVALVPTGDVARVAGWAAVGLLILAPVARVGGLAARWWRQGDRRFAAWAAGLFALLVAALASALISG